MEIQGECMKLVVAFFAFLFVACSVSENPPVRDIELYHPHKAVVDTTLEN